MASRSTNTLLLLLTFSLCNFCHSSEIGETDRKICELTINKELPQNIEPFKQKKIHTENGVHIRHQGKICNNNILVDVDIENKLVKKIYVAAPKFCHDTICIGDKFYSIIKKKPDATIYFSGEEGGILSVRDKIGINYIFHTEGIKMKCYTEPESCKKDIDKAQLISIVI